MKTFNAIQMVVPLSCDVGESTISCNIKTVDGHHYLKMSIYQTTDVSFEVDFSFNNVDYEDLRGFADNLLELSRSIREKQ